MLFRVMQLRDSKGVITTPIQPMKPPCKVIMVLLVTVYVIKEVEVVATMTISMEVQWVEASLNIGVG